MMKTKKQTSSLEDRVNNASVNSEGVGTKTGNAGHGPELFDKANGRYVSSGDARRDYQIIQKDYDKNKELPKYFKAKNGVNEQFDKNISTPYSEKVVLPKLVKVMNEAFKGVIEITGFKINENRFTDAIFGVDAILFGNRPGFEELYIDIKTKTGEMGKNKPFPPENLTFSLLKEDDNNLDPIWGNFINTNKINDFYLFTFPNTGSRTFDNVSGMEEIISSNNILLDNKSMKKYLVDNIFGGNLGVKSDGTPIKSIEEKLLIEAKRYKDKNFDIKPGQKRIFKVDNDGLIQIECKNMIVKGSKKNQSRYNVNLIVNYKKLKEKMNRFSLMEFSTNDDEEKARDLIKY